MSSIPEVTSVSRGGGEESRSRCTRAVFSCHQSVSQYQQREHMAHITHSCLLRVLCKIIAFLNGWRLRWPGCRRRAGWRGGFTPLTFV